MKINPLPRPKKRDKRMRRNLRNAKSELPIPTRPMPLRDPEKRRWMTHQQCAIYGSHICWSPDRGDVHRPGSTWFHLSFFYLSDPAHCDKGGSEKIGDEFLIPLCRTAHDEQERNHEAFDKKYKIDRYTLAKMYHEMYLTEKAK